MLLKRIDKFFSKFNKFFFNYKNGFFELPFLANSPQSMINSFESMPFVKHNKDEQLIISTNPFVDVKLHYCELEEGFWLNLAETKYKANVNFKLIYDKYLESDYYFLNLFINNVNNKVKLPLVNGISYNNRSWSFFKPKASVVDCHFKGSQGLYVTLYFNESWLKKMILKNDEIINLGIKQFIESDKKYIIWPDLTDSDFYHTFYHVFLSKQMDLVQKKEIFLAQSLSFMKFFFNKYDLEKISDSHFEILDIDRIKVLKVEKILIENLFVAFPGIENLGKEIGMSETKLKLNFKLIFGKTIYQYYLDKQMIFAKENILNKKLKIKEVSEILGYENQSKFSLAFKNQFGVLPSEIK